MQGQASGSFLALLFEVVTGVWRRFWAPLRAAWRRSWICRLWLGGRMPDRIPLHPRDYARRRLEDADSMLRGRFRFHGETVDARGGSIFDKRPPSAAWAESLHAFAWLPPLAIAGGDAARVLATSLISQWLKRYGRYSEPAWRADVLGRRLMNLFAYGQFVLPNSDVLWRSKLLVSLREQSRMLAGISREAPDGVRRLEAASAH